MTIVRFALTLVLIGTLAAAAPAAKVDVEVGWGGFYRYMRWSPIFITASDIKPRIVVIELYVPHDSLHAMTITQTVTIGPAPATFVLYAPLGMRQEEMTVKLHEPGSFRNLATWVNDPTYGLGPMTMSENINQLIGISGRGGNHRVLEGHFKSRNVKSADVDLLRLPTVSRAYESFNVLLLDQPDLSRLTLDQQEAMIQWVRGGGSVVCWMGEDQLPPTSPLLDALPVTIGENTSITVSPDSLEQAGLPKRFGNLKGRTLEPRNGATPIKLFGGEVTAWQHSIGLGSIIVVPFDCSTLLFNNTDKAADFWIPLLRGWVDLRKPEKDDQGQNSVYYGNFNDPIQNRRASSATHVMDKLGDVPGAGRFGFTSVAMVMLGLMLLVGPVDWIVLKKLGRQPWTWITTSGWIALVTLGAVYIGHMFRSGDLHFRTMRLIDQAGGSIIGTVDAIGIYSPRTSEYTLKTDPETWWEPLTSEQYFYRGGRKTDIGFHQDYRGNTMLPMRINVWNLRFMMSDQPASGPALLESDLTYESRGAGNNHIVGTIKNVGTLPVRNLALRGGGGYCMIGTDVIEPGATLNIDRRLSSNPTPQKGTNGPVYPPQVGAEPFFDLAMERSRRVDELLKSRQDIVCIYAEIADAPAAAELSPAPTQQQHQQMIRAVLPLKRANP